MVAVSGYGSVSSLGNNNNEFRYNYLNGISGISVHNDFSNQFNKCIKVAHVKEFSFKDYKPRKSFIRLDINCKYAFKACAQALEMACLSKYICEEHIKVGIVVANTYIGANYSWDNMETLIEKSTRYINPSNCMTGIYTVLSNVYSEFGITGYSNTVNSGYTASHAAVLCAMDRITSGKEDVMIVVGTDPLNKVMLSVAKKLGIIVDYDEEELYGPFDVNRNKEVMGEACGVVVLENIEHAQARGAKIYGKITGMGYGSEKHLTSVPVGDGVFKSMQNALKKAGRTVGDIDFIFSSANSTKKIDLMEGKGILQLLNGDCQKVYITAIKAIIGETFSASGVMNLIAALETLNNGYLPPIHNLKEKDEAFMKLNLAQQPVFDAGFKAGVINGAGRQGDCYSMVVEKEH